MRTALSAAPRVSALRAAARSDSTARGSDSAGATRRCAVTCSSGAPAAVRIIAARNARACAAESLIGVREAGPHDRADAGAGQRSRPQEGVVLGGIAQGGERLFVGDRLSGAAGHDEPDRQLADAPCQIGEETQ